MTSKFVNSWEGISSVLVNWIKTKHLRRKNEYDTMRLCSETPNEYRKMWSFTHLYRSTCSETPNEYRKMWSFAQLCRSLCSVTLTSNENKKTCSVSQLQKYEFKLYRSIYSVTPNEYRKKCSVTQLYRSMCSLTPNEYRKTCSFTELYRSTVYVH